jgi:YVTN family beta-propeller protein
MKTRALPLLLLAALLASCKTNPSGPNNPAPAPNLAKAVYVLNEGDFSDPTGARLTIYDVEKDSVYRDVYEGANGGSHLGNVGDDMKFYNGKAYIVMSGSKNLIVINLATNRKELEVSFPGSAVHDIVIDSVRSRLYLTRLFSSSVYVLNLNSLALIDSIVVGSNPQGMAISNGKLFVCNSGYGSDSTVTIVDASTNRVLATKTVGPGPTGAAVAPDGRVWISCTGNPFSTVPASGVIVILDPQTNGVTDQISLGGFYLWGPISISSDGYAYLLGVTPGSFYGGPVHRISLQSKSVALDFIAGTFYGLAFDDVAREIYVSDVRDFLADGTVRIYTNAGALRKSFTAQKGPAVFSFKR